MLDIPGYSSLKHCYTGSRTQVYRGVRTSDGNPVIIKALATLLPTPIELARFKMEYQIARELDLDGVITVNEIGQHRSRWYMEIEDGGADLTGLTVAGSLTVPEWLGLATRIAHVLGLVHEKHVIHKDITPANIVWDRESDRVRIIDFGLASQLFQENSLAVSPNTLEGTLTYIAPEQTGRMNRAVDYRSDLYSLGATLYHLITGEPPFSVDDAVEMVHCHIARAPRSPDQLNPDIPGPVARIILKLLAKNAEDRYQSAFGLERDLRRCLEQLDAHGEIADFAIGVDDIYLKVRIPQKLYGREREVGTLLQTFDSVSDAGDKQLMLIAGYSGIGKTVVVHEVHKSLVRQRGHFISGKFDLVKRSTPYAPFLEAFEGLIEHLLGEGEEGIARWKDAIVDALHPNTQALVEVIPKLELIAGEQPPVQELPPAESQNRLLIGFRKFVQVFATSEHPLVIFIDDLQWVDSATLALIDALMTDPDIRHLLLICAYRDNEVDANHSFVLALEELRKKGIRQQTITLAPLALHYIAQLLADTLLRTPEDTEKLARLCLAKTGGNPFFLNQFLYNLDQEGVFSLNEERTHWQWDLDRIEQMQITDNVVDIMVTRLRRLQPDTQSVLRLASCIGHQFELATLAIVSEKSAQETGKDLWEALQQGMLVPMDVNYRFLPELEGAPNVKYRFQHDRVQQAAYSLIPAEQRAAVHLRIGWLFYDNQSEQERDENLFEIVNHLNIGVEFIAEPAKIALLAELNLRAGKKAKAAAAYSQAFSYLQTGINLLGDDCWTSGYDTALSFHVEGAEAAYTIGNFEQMASWGQVVIDNAKNLTDQAQAYEVLIQGSIARSKLTEAVDIALTILAKLGVTFPAEPTFDDIVAAIAATRAAFADRKVEELASLPPMTDPHMLIVQRILPRILSASLTAIPALCPLLVYKQVQLAIEHGNAPDSIMGYVNYAPLICALEQDYDTGYRFGVLAIDLLDTLDAEPFRARATHMMNGFVRHWKDPLRDTIGPLLDVYRIGLENGDVEYAAYGLWMRANYTLLSGRNLDDAEPDMEKSATASRQLNQDIALNYLLITWQFVRNLMGLEDDHLRLVGKAYDEDEMLPVHVAANDGFALCILYADKTMLNYWFHRYDEALENALLAEERFASVLGMCSVVIATFYESLTRLVLYEDASPDEREAHLAKVEANQAKMATWAEHAPMNYRHKWCLVEAEKKRVLGDDMAAMRMYAQAIEQAHANLYIHEEALANELTGRFHQKRGRQNAAKGYFSEAHYLYDSWGAKAKARTLGNYRGRRGGRRAATNLTMTTVSGENLDLASVLKASQAIAGEIVLGDLLRKMMAIVVENAGAQRGLLLLPNGSSWFVRARVDETGVSYIDGDSMPIVGGQVLPLTIVNYVLKTEQAVHLDEACHIGSFTADPYIAANATKSILCLPIIHQARLVAVIYLENSLTTRAFSGEQLEVLQLLSAQIAVSMENAGLYANLEKKVAERTHALKLRTAEIAEKNRELERYLQELQDKNQQILKAQNQLVLSEKMATLGTLTAGVAHEFNNPNNFIYGGVQILEDELSKFKETLSSLLDEDADQEMVDILMSPFGRMNENLAVIREGSVRIREVVKDMQDFSRLDRADMKRVDLLDNLRSTVSLIRSQYSNVEFALDLSGELWRECRPAELSQVYLNLVLNACQAIEARREMEGDDAPAIMRISARRDGYDALITFDDSGHGVPVEHRDKLFEAFFTTKPVGSGTGLGLYSAWRIVNEHGGRIALGDKDELGAVFTVRLPVEK